MGSPSFVEYYVSSIHFSVSARTRQEPICESTGVRLRRKKAAACFPAGGNPDQGTKKARPEGELVPSVSAAIQTARVTLPLRRQRVHTYTCFGLPSTMALTRLTLGFQVRLERLWEWLTLMPKATPLSQNSHFAILLHLLH
jgi:hypothetical protein